MFARLFGLTFVRFWVYSPFTRIPIYRLVAGKIAYSLKHFIRFPVHMLHPSEQDKTDIAIQTIRAHNIAASYFLHNENANRVSLNTLHQLETCIKEGLGNEIQIDTSEEAREHMRTYHSDIFAQEATTEDIILVSRYALNDNLCFTKEFRLLGSIKKTYNAIIDNFLEEQTMTEGK